MKSRNGKLGLLVAFAALLVPAGASADSVFKTQHIALTPLDGAPLRSGFVQQIHANGPIVYGTDAVVLNGALPRTTYVAVMFVSPFDPTCASGVVPFGGLTFKTNAAGNGRGATGIIPPEAIPDVVRGHVDGFYWVVFSGGAPAYATSCAPLPAD
jgi:hypothetical protein